jgi:hypothetical protein
MRQSLGMNIGFARQLAAFFVRVQAPDALHRAVKVTCLSELPLPYTAERRTFGMLVDVWTEIDGTGSSITWAAFREQCRNHALLCPLVDAAEPASAPGPSRSVLPITNDKLNEQGRGIHMDTATGRPAVTVRSVPMAVDMQGPAHARINKLLDHAAVPVIGSGSLPVATATATGQCLIASDPDDKAHCCAVFSEDGYATDPDMPALEPANKTHTGTSGTLYATGPVGDAEDVECTADAFRATQRALLRAPGGIVDQILAMGRAQMRALKPRAAIPLMDLGWRWVCSDAPDLWLITCLVAALHEAGFKRARLARDLHHWECKGPASELPCANPRRCSHMIVFEW